jgi:uncharacterized protein
VTPQPTEMTELLASRHTIVTSPPRLASPPRLRLLLRALELVSLFVALPLALRWQPVGVPRLGILGLVTAGCVGVLLRDPSFEWRRLFALGDLRGSLRTTGLRALLVAAVVAALVWVLRPEALLAVPKGGAVPWLAGLAAYPVLSAWPQEVLYRVFFFHRYAPLLGPAGLVAANAAAFGLLHAVYPNLLAPLLSVPAGLLLALTYRRTGAIGPVWLEHAVYGLLLFGLGLGRIFFDGAA